MAEGKRYYWLKLKEEFFNKKEIKKLRRVAGGDTYTVIYLKMLLLSLRDDGFLYYDGIEDSLVEELALTMDEDVNNVRVTISYLLSVGLIEQVDSEQLRLTEMPEMIGSESWSAKRVRRHRQRQKILQNEVKALHCNGDVTCCNQEIDIEQDTDTDTELETDKEKKKTSLNDEFETLWKLYPNKKGKKEARASYERARKKGTSYEVVESGIRDYVEYIKATKNEKFIKHGSTFFSQEAWLDDWSVPGQPKEQPIDDGLDEIF